MTFSAQLDQVKSQVRKAPGDASHRVAYFQLLCIQGEWEKAVDQLALVEELDPANVLFAQTYARAVRCEIERRRVHTGGDDPVVFGEPLEWIGLLIEAFRHAREKRWDAAQRAQALAFEGAPATVGLLDGEAIAWVADADSRYGPVLEAFIEGHYRWMPFERLARLEITAPKHLIDLVWLQAKFTLTNGGAVDGLIPVRYFGSESSSEESVRRAETTAWDEVAPEFVIGRGHRLLATDCIEVALAQVRQCEFASPAQL